MPQTVIRERLLAELPDVGAAVAQYWDPNTPIVYVDHAQVHFAYVVKEGAREYIVLDGHRQPAYDAIESIGTGQVQSRRFFFSPNGKRFAYVGRRHGKYVLVVDGNERAKLEQPIRPFFGPSGRLAYAIKQREARPDYERGYRDNSRMVIDGVAGMSRPYMTCLDPVFSPDGRHVVYFAWDWRDTLHLVIDGRDVRQFSGDSYPVVRFSPHGQTFAYFVRRGHNTVLVVNGRELSVDPPFFLPQLPDEMPLLVTDDGHFAFISDAYDDSGGLHVVVDGRRDRIYTGGIDELCMSSDGRHFAYMAADKDKYLAVVDDVESTPYEQVSGIRISPDGGHVAYVASTDRKQEFVVLDGKQGTAYAQIGVRGLTFSPDGRRLCFYATKSDGTSVLVVQGEQLREYPAGYNYFDQDVAFSPNGKHVAYTNMRKGHASVGLDGHAIGVYDGRPDGASLAFDKAGHFRTVAIRDRKIIAVEVWPERLAELDTSSAP